MHLRHEIDDTIAPPTHNMSQMDQFCEISPRPDSESPIQAKFYNIKSSTNLRYYSEIVFNPRFRAGGGRRLEGGERGGGAG